MSLQHQLVQAATALQQQQFEDAVAAAQTVLHEQPAHPEALLILGLASLQLGRTDLALDCLGKVAAAEPRRADVRYNLAIAQERAGRFDAACQSYRQVLASVPGQVESSCNLARVLIRQSRVSDAVDVLRACRDRHPADTRVAIALASALVDGGDFGAAVDLCGRLLDSSPGDMRIHNQLALALAAQGQADAAISQCREALATYGGHRDVGLTLGRLLLTHGETDNAVDYFRGLVNAYPDDNDAVNGLAVALHRIGDGNEAAAILETATERHPESVQTWYNLAAVYSDLEKNKYLDRAEAATRRAIALNPAHAAAHACLGLIGAKTDRPDLAIASLQHAVELDGEFYDARINLADTLEKTGQRDAALGVLAKAVERFPERPEAYRQSGIFQLRERRAEAALEALQASYDRDMLDQRTIAHLAVAMEELGHDAAAARLKGMDRFIFPLRPEPPPGWDRIEAFNAELAHDILAHPSLQWEPLGLAARGGSLTGNLLQSPTPAILGWEKLLRAAIDSLVARLEVDPGHPFLKRLPRRYRLNSWACVVPEGGVIDTHIHEQSWLSGAYYVSLPGSVSEQSETDHEGWIEFGRPTREIPVSRAPQLRLIQPAEGMLVLFPSYLYHRTLPFHGGENRISVSFDLEPLG